MNRAYIFLSGAVFFLFFAAVQFVFAEPYTANVVLSGSDTFSDHNGLYHADVRK